MDDQPILDVGTPNNSILISPLIDENETMEHYPFLGSSAIKAAKNPASPNRQEEKPIL